MEPRFQFDEATHTYTVDGVQVPSVTQILETVGISDFSGVPFERLQYAQDLGVAVHKATEAYDQDDLDWSSIEGSVVEPCLAAWIAFRKQTGFIPRLIERRGVAQVAGQRYGFCLDREGDLDGRATVLDIKTGEKSRAWPIQLSAYELALFLLDGQHRRRAAVRLHGDGEFAVIQFMNTQDEHCWRWALGLETWKRLNP